MQKNLQFWVTTNGCSHNVRSGNPLLKHLWFMLQWMCSVGLVQCIYPQYKSFWMDMVSEQPFFFLHQRGVLSDWGFFLPRVNPDYTETNGAHVLGSLSWLCLLDHRKWANCFAGSWSKRTLPFKWVFGNQDSFLENISSTLTTTSQLNFTRDR